MAVSEAKRQEAKKLELLAQVFKPYDQTQQHMRELAKEWQQTKRKKKKEIKLVKVKKEGKQPTRQFQKNARGLAKKKTGAGSQKPSTEGPYFWEKQLQKPPRDFLFYASCCKVTHPQLQLDIDAVLL
jgi:hypothetical protein